METGLLILLIFAACLALSFVFSGMEAGVFALSRLRVRQQMRTGKASARLLHQFLENPENFLWTILVGNTIANFIILGFTILWLHKYFVGHRILFAAVFCVLVFLFYALFDLLPKMLFRLYPNRLCMLMARPFRFLHIGLRPLVAVVEGGSRVLLKWTGGRAFTGHLFGNREELRFLMQESGQAFTSEERAMINRVLDLQNITVRQVAIPLSNVVSVSSEMLVSDVLALARERQLTRFPVWQVREGRRRIIGIVSTSALLYQATPEQRVSEFVKPALYLDEDLRLEVALQRLQRAGQRLAIVLARDGSEAGILSLQDILKVMFGEVSL